MKAEMGDLAAAGNEMADLLEDVVVRSGTQGEVDRAMVALRTWDELVGNDD